MESVKSYGGGGWTLSKFDADEKKSGLLIAFMEEDKLKPCFPKVKLKELKKMQINLNYLFSFSSSSHVGFDLIEVGENEVTRSSLSNYVKITWP